MGMMRAYRSRRGSLGLAADGLVFATEWSLPGVSCAVSRHHGEAGNFDHRGRALLAEGPRCVIEDSAVERKLRDAYRAWLGICPSGRGKDCSRS
jgi:hypothetical protein